MTSRSNVVRFAPRGANGAAQGRDFVGRLRNLFKSGQLDEVCTRQKVRPASVLAVAKLISSGRFPSFWNEGVYARAETLGADCDVGLSARQVGRILNFLEQAGAIERIKRPGRTTLLRPARSMDPRHGVASCPDTMSAHQGHHVRGTPDTMSDDLSYKNKSDGVNEPPPPGALKEWASILAALLIDTFGPARFDAWFSKAQVAQANDREIVLFVPTRFMARQINQRFGEDLIACVRSKFPSMERVDVRAAQS